MPHRAKHVGTLEGSGTLIDETGVEYPVEFQIRDGAIATLRFVDPDAFDASKVEDAVLLTDEHHSAWLDGDVTRDEDGTVHVPIIRSAREDVPLYPVAQNNPLQRVCISKAGRRPSSRKAPSASPPLRNRTGWAFWTECSSCAPETSSIR